MSGISALFLTFKVYLKVNEIIVTGHLGMTNPNTCISPFGFYGNPLSFCNGEWNSDISVQGFWKVQPRCVLLCPRL